MSVTINGTNGLTFNDASTQTTAATGFGFKNRIINGDMRIDQRNAGASVSVQTNAYPSVDRWFWQNILSSSITATAQQNAGSVTPPAGFTNYLGLTSGGTFSPADNDTFVWKQTVEGYNVSDLAWGTAAAKPIAISFWVRSSLTGTFSGAVAGLTGGTSSWVFTYTISSANTWEYKTIYVDGNTTTALGSTTTGGALQLRFCVCIGSGTTYGTSTVNQWTSGNFFGVTGSTNVLGTNGATFYITGVQLEKGSTATSFDYRPYGTELALCQRYYETGFSKFFFGMTPTSGVAFSAAFKVTKRAAPTQTYSNSPGGMTTATPTSNEAITVDGFSVFKSSANEMAFSWAASVEL